MCWKNCLMAVVAVFVAKYGLDYVIHNILFVPDYTAMKIYNPAPNQLYLILGQVLFALAFVWIYVKGLEAKKSWVVQGVKYGVAVWLLMIVSWAFIHASLALVDPDVMFYVKQMVYGLVQMVVLGLIVAVLHKDCATKVCK